MTQTSEFFEKFVPPFGGNRSFCPKRSRVLAVPGERDGQQNGSTTRPLVRAEGTESAYSQATIRSLTRCA